jgi:hypothetical protein
MIRYYYTLTKLRYLKRLNLTGTKVNDGDGYPRLLGTNHNDVELFTRANFPRLEVLYINRDYSDYNNSHIPLAIQKELPNCKVRFNRKKLVSVAYAVFMFPIFFLVIRPIISIIIIVSLVLGLLVHKAFLILTAFVVRASDRLLKNCKYSVNPVRFLSLTLHKFFDIIRW